MSELLGVVFLIVIAFALRGAYLIVRDKQKEWDSNRKRSSNKKRHNK